MDVNMCVLLLFKFMLLLKGGTAEPGTARNDCDPKGFGKNALHVCNEGTTSGAVVAMDASKFNGYYCECKLEHSGIRDNNFTVIIDYRISDKSRINLDVDGDMYGDTNKEHVHTSDGSSINILAEKKSKIETSLRTRNLCLAFKLPPNVKGPGQLNLTCFNGTKIKPNTTAIVENTPNPPSSKTEKDTVSVTQATSPTTKTVVETTTRRMPNTRTTHSTTEVSTTLPSTLTTTKPRGSSITTRKSTETDVRSSSTSVGVGSLPAIGVETEVPVSEETTETDITEGDKTGTSDGSVVPIVVVVVVVCCAAISILVLCCIKRRKSASKAKNEEVPVKDVSEAPSKPEDDYIITENAMYVPMEVRALLDKKVEEDTESAHTYDEADLDTITNNRNRQEMDKLLIDHSATDLGTIHDNHNRQGTDKLLQNDNTQGRPTVDIEENVDDIPNETEDTGESGETIVTIDNGLNGDVKAKDIYESNEHIYDISG